MPQKACAYAESSRKEDPLITKMLILKVAEILIRYMQSGAVIENYSER